MRKLLSISTLVALLATSCATAPTSTRPPNLPITYHDTQRDLKFLLPATWQGYSVRVEQWEALPPDGTGLATKSGPIIVIRHPRWTVKIPQLYPH